MVPMAIYDYLIVSVSAVLPAAFMTFSAQARNFLIFILKNSTVHLSYPSFSSLLIGPSEVYHTTLQTG